MAETQNFSCPACQLVLRPADDHGRFQTARLRAANIIEQAFLEMRITKETSPYSLSKDLQAKLAKRIEELAINYPGTKDDKSWRPLLQYALDELFNFGPLAALVRNELIQHIYVRSWELVYAEHCGSLEQVGYQFESAAQLHQIINNLAYPFVFGSHEPFISRDLSEILVPYEATNRSLFKGWIQAFLNEKCEPTMIIRSQKPPSGDDRIAPPSPGSDPTRLSISN